MFDGDGAAVSGSDIVCTYFTVKLLGANGETLDSRTIVVKGDVNGDGECDSIDASTVFRIDAGLTDCDEAAYLASDVSGDGEADAIDAVMILKYDCGLLGDL